MPGTRLISGRDVRDAFKPKTAGGMGRVGALRHFKTLLQERKLSPSDFSIRELFEALIPDGHEFLRPDKSAYDLQALMHPPVRFDGSGRALLEAGDGSSAVGYSDFSNITGQLFFTEIKEQYESEEFIFTSEITSKASTIQDIEKIPGISRIGVQGLGPGGPGSQAYAGLINEGAEYPRFGVSEDYQEISYKQKKGGIVEVTTEAVRGDLTGVLLDRCGQLGYFLGVDKEMRIIDAVIDQNAGATSAYNGGHRYTWKGTAYGTFQSSVPWVNVKASNALVDETNIDAAWQVQAQIVDPYTKLPILVMPDRIIVSPTLAFQAQRLLLVQEIRRTNPGYAVSGVPTQSVGGPALAKVVPGLQVLTSRLLYSRMNTASETTTDWFLANLKKAIHHYYNWDIITTQRSTGTEAEFERDVVLQFKASIKDVVSVFEPRLMFKNTA